jgi:hypothetical protein
LGKRGVENAKSDRKMGSKSRGKSEPEQKVNSPAPAPPREELTRPAPMPTSTPISSGDEELTAEERANLELQWGHGLSAVDIEPYERENLQGSVCEGV